MSITFASGAPGNADAVHVPATAAFARLFHAQGQPIAGDRVALPRYLVELACLAAGPKFTATTVRPTFKTHRLSDAALSLYVQGFELQAFDFDAPSSFQASLALARVIGHTSANLDDAAFEALPEPAQGDDGDGGGDFEDQFFDTILFQSFDRTGGADAQMRGLLQVLPAFGPRDSIAQRADGARKVFSRLMAYMAQDHDKSPRPVRPDWLMNASDTDLIDKLGMYLQRGISTEVFLLPDTLDLKGLQKYLQFYNNCRLRLNMHDVQACVNTALFTNLHAVVGGASREELPSALDALHKLFNTAEPCSMPSELALKRLDIVLGQFSHFATSAGPSLANRVQAIFHAKERAKAEKDDLRASKQGAGTTSTLSSVPLSSSEISRVTISAPFMEAERLLSQAVDDPLQYWSAFFKCVAAGKGFLIQVLSGRLYGSGQLFYDFRTNQPYLPRYLDAAFRLDGNQQLDPLMAGFHLPMSFVRYINNFEIGKAFAFLIKAAPHLRQRWRSGHRDVTTIKEQYPAELDAQHLDTAMTLLRNMGSAIGFNMEDPESPVHHLVDVVDYLKSDEIAADFRRSQAIAMMESLMHEIQNHTKGHTKGDPLRHFDGRMLDSAGEFRALKQEALEGRLYLQKHIHFVLPGLKRAAVVQPPLDGPKKKPKAPDPPRASLVSAPRGTPPTRKPSHSYRSGDILKQDDKELQVFWHDRQAGSDHYFSFNLVEIAKDLGIRVDEKNWAYVLTKANLEEKYQPEKRGDPKFHEPLSDDKFKRYNNHMSGFRTIHSFRP